MIFLFTVKISNALSWPISKDTKNVFTLLTCNIKAYIMFPQKLPPTNRGQKLVMVTNQQVLRPPTTSFAHFQEKTFFLFNYNRVQNILGIY